MTSFNFDHPLDASSDAGLFTPELSSDELNALMKQIKIHLQEASSQTLQQSSVLYWLSYGLYCAVSKKEPGIVQQASEIISNFIQKDPIIFMSLLKQTIPGGKFKGLTPLYLWVNNFHLATFNPDNFPYIKAMNLIFTQLLTEPFRESFSAGLMEQVTTEVDAKGKTPLFVLSQALLQATTEPYNEDCPLLIAHLLKEMLVSCPVLGLAASKPILEGGLIHKSVVYMLACALRAATRTSHDAVAMICELLDRIHAQYPVECDQILSSDVGEGNYKGYHPLHIILTALVSAAYLDNNVKDVTKIADLIKHVVDSSENAIHLQAMQAPITSGVNLNQTGFMLLERARYLAERSNIPTEIFDAVCQRIKQSEESTTRLR